MSQQNITMFDNLCVKQDKSERLYVYQIDENTFILSKKLEANYWQGTIISRSTYTALDSLSPKMISRILAMAPKYYSVSDMWNTLKDKHNPPRDDIFSDKENPNFVIYTLDYLLFLSHINVQAYDMLYGYIIVKANDNIYRIDVMQNEVTNNKKCLFIDNLTAKEHVDNAEKYTALMPIPNDKASLFDMISFCLDEIKIKL